MNIEELGSGNHIGETVRGIITAKKEEPSMREWENDKEEVQEWRGEEERVS